MRGRITYLVFGILALVLLNPRPGLAIPVHGNPHGFFIHQAAHLLITAAMFFFVYSLGRGGLLQFKGFRLLGWASGVFGIWSLEHYLGHWAEDLLVNPVILGEGLSRRLLMDGLDSWVYYFTQMDNWLLLLAFFLLYRGLKTLSQEMQAGSK